MITSQMGNWQMKASAEAAGCCGIVALSALLAGCHDGERLACSHDHSPLLLGLETDPAESRGPVTLPQGEAGTALEVVLGVSQHEPQGHPEVLVDPPWVASASLESYTVYPDWASTRLVSDPGRFAPFTEPTARMYRYVVTRHSGESAAILTRWVEPSSEPNALLRDARPLEEQP